MKTLLTVLILCAGAAWAAEKFTDKELAARFYYDLGADTVDVSGYPKAQQDGYAAFAKTCAQCHTLARPINSPIAAKEDWRRYITRMHLKTKSTKGTDFSVEDARVILDFLAFDSNARKLKAKKDFDAKTAELKARFESVLAARSRRQKELDGKKVKDAPMPGQGVAPQP
jgi:uncharacterized protein (DUF1800 family)